MFGKFTDHPEMYAWVLALVGLAGIISMILSNKTIPPELWTLEGITVGGALGVTAPAISNGLSGTVAAQPAAASSTGQVAETPPPSVTGPTA